jgi:murein DD-endopeptidase MepM/ murein hydrolase activator NlpD
VEVRSAQHGTVVFADDLGIYGSTVIVDHGLGLSTLYGHLSSISVNTGDSVTLETVLGRSGATGLAGGDHLHFEIRLWNTPVSPFEWWDSRWNKDHVDDKILSASTVQPS